jgi:hypothetical protein
MLSITQPILEIITVFTAILSTGMLLLFVFEMSTSVDQVKLRKNREQKIISLERKWLALKADNEELEEKVYYLENENRTMSHENFTHILTIDDLHTEIGRLHRDDEHVGENDRLKIKYEKLRIKCDMLKTELNLRNSQKETKPNLIPI